MATKGSGPRASESVMGAETFTFTTVRQQSTRWLSQVYNLNELTSSVAATARRSVKQRSNNVCAPYAHQGAHRWTRSCPLRPCHQG